MKMPRSIRNVLHRTGKVSLLSNLIPLEPQLFDKFYYSGLGRTYTTQKVKDVCQYLDLITKIKANSQNGTKHLENLNENIKYP